MLEVIADPDVKVQQWMDALDGNADWDVAVKGYVSSVDWPAAAFWHELAGEYPDALVLLSTRASTDAWFRSYSETIFQVMLRDVSGVVHPCGCRWLSARRSRWVWRAASQRV